MTLLLGSAWADSKGVDARAHSALREYAQAMLGQGFDGGGFNQVLLSGSGLSPEDLERRVGEWISSRQRFRATVRRGPHGVPHIEADNFGSLGYGEAYVAAEDHLCNIAYGLMQATGNTARYLGPGGDNAHFALDAVVRALRVEAQARTAFAAQSDEMREWLAGYTAGFNRYVREHPGQEAGSWCAGAAWVREASPLDFMARLVMVAQTLPRMSAALTSAQPPAAEEPPAEKLAFSRQQLVASLDAARLTGMGSNGWALGREMTENGRGMLLANPHYPWYGGSRFWEKHLTIPGRFDVYGANLLGSPGVAIGFNDSVGWTHTVSASQRLVLYRLQLDPENPLRYRHGDSWRQLEERRVEVPVLTDDGAVQLRPYSLYFSHHGPLLNLPDMSWNSDVAYAVRDANSGNYSLLAQWRAMGEARDMDEFVDAHRRFNAMPWVNTMAASADGRAVYLDNSTVGNLSDRAQELWRASLATDRLAAGLYQEREMVLLDGSDPENDWIDDGAPIAATVPFEKRPMLERSDYIFNSNDSYWLTNPDSPMSGYSILYGPVESARSLRTRMNLRLLNNHYGDAGEDARFSRDEVKAALFANRGLTAELLLPDLLSVCGSTAEPLRAACEVLRAYDGTLNLDSPGAVLFREWITRYDMGETFAAGRLFAEDFNIKAPVETPRVLGDADAALAALDAAVSVLEAAELPLDASLRDAQFAWRGGEAIAVHGGNGFEGVANLQMSGNPGASPIAGVSPQKIGDSRYLTDAGYPVLHGSSFIVTLGFDDQGPVAEALLSYSQSGDPGSAHFADQTKLYAEKTWRKVAFHAEDIKRQAQSTLLLVSPPSP